MYDTGEENVQILSYVNMIQELIAAHDGFKIIQNLCKNEIIESLTFWKFIGSQWRVSEITDPRAILVMSPSERLKTMYN